MKERHSAESQKNVHSEKNSGSVPEGLVLSLSRDKGKALLRFLLGWVLAMLPVS